MITELLIESPLELTTSATDAVLAIECVLIIIYLRRFATADRWRVSLWTWKAEEACTDAGELAVKFRL